MQERSYRYRAIGSGLGPADHTPIEPGHAVGAPDVPCTAGGNQSGACSRVLKYPPIFETAKSCVQYAYMQSSRRLAIGIKLLVLINLA